MADNKDVMHQGKTIAQWAKDFKGEFTEDQLVKMARGGCDLEKILKLGLDEDEELTPYEGLPGEPKAVFESAHSIKDYMMPNCQIRVFDVDGNEIYWAWIDASYLKTVIPYIGTGICGASQGVQAGALIPAEMMRKFSGQELTTMIYVDGDPLSIDHDVLRSQIADVEEREKQVKKNTFSPDQINHNIAEDTISHDDEMAAFNESIEDDIVTVGDFAKGLKKNLAKDSDKIMFRDQDKHAYEVLDMHGKGGVFVVDLIPAVAGQKSLDESDEDNDKKDTDMNEGRNWRTGGYGGYGRTYQSYGDANAPRGKAISWFNVSELDPKAAGKMHDWRVGPSNFPFKDLLYPERKYKVGTTVLRSKFMKAGDESGVKYIAVPSYLDAIRSNDEAAIELLKALDIPLDLTFGYGPNEDFTGTYTISKT